jgi:hypothetical protein
MDSLTKNKSIALDSGDDSCTRIKIAEPEDTRHCVAPPAPTEKESDEMFGLEAGLIRLPVMSAISDPYVLEELVLFTRSEKLHEMAEDLGLFDEEEEKSTVDSHTIAPGRIRRKLDDIA